MNSLKLSSLFLFLNKVRNSFVKFSVKPLPHKLLRNGRKFKSKKASHSNLTIQGCYSSHCITSYVLLSNNHDSMCTLVSPEKVIKTAFKICQKLFSGEFSSSKEINLTGSFMPIKLCLSSPNQSPITYFFLPMSPKRVRIST